VGGHSGFFWMIGPPPAARQTDNRAWWRAFRSIALDGALDLKPPSVLRQNRLLGQWRHRNREDGCLCKDDSQRDNDSAFATPPNSREHAAQGEPSFKKAEPLALRMGLDRLAGSAEVVGAQWF